MTYILSLVTPLFGIVSLYSFLACGKRLARSSSTCRSLGSKSTWALDHSDWEFCPRLLYRLSHHRSQYLRKPVECPDCIIIFVDTAATIMQTDGPAKTTAGDASSRTVSNLVFKER